MILVTGATGLIGSHLIYNLLKTNTQVIALKRISSDISRIKKVFGYYSNNADELFSRIIWREADMLDYEEVNSALKGVSFIYHCAAIVSFEHKDKNKLLKTNVEGTSNLINAALNNKVNKLCHVSSIAALGNNQNEITNETSPREQSSNRSLYSESKYMSELEVWRGIEEGLNAVIVNPSVVIGPGNWKNGSSSLFYNVWKGMKFFTEGITGYVDVTDVVRIMQLLMESNIENQRFVVSSENISYKELFNEIADNLKLKQPKYNANKFILDMAWRLDKIKSIFSGQKHQLTKETAYSALDKQLYSNDKICKALNYNFIPIKESIKKTSGIFINDLKTNNI
jgi:nucleoside-diphosphate-sugar epimerase